MPSPLVSVIMPCFNAGPMLRAALRSVVEQSYPAIEIVFVDNNSTDGSAALAREIAAGAPHRSWRFAECSEQGVNRARNLWFSLASGAYIQWMDADDSLDKDKIALQVAALEAAPETDIAYGDWTICHIETARPNLERRHNLSQDDDQVLRALAGVWYPPHLYLLRRSAAQQLQDAQAWWPARTVATDVEYTALAALLGLRFRHVAGAHVSYNIWSRGQTSRELPPWPRSSRACGSASRREAPKWR
jgi:glycosyltransferase involved in cell wall biosynthesis